MLFSADLHEPLLDAAWAPAEAEAAIRAIVRDAEEALTDDWWPGHPRDYEEGDPDVWHGIYLGAAGVLSALDHLGSGLLLERLAGELLESYVRRPEFDRPPSAWLGESGIALVAWRLAPSAALADRLAELVRVPDVDTLELMWGSPGLLLIADAMLEATGEPRWASAWHALADHVMERRDERGLWTQELYGKSAQFLGPAHGMAGVVAALARRRSIDTVDALERTAVREGAHANWPPLADVPLERKGEIAPNGATARPAS